MEWPSQRIPQGGVFHPQKSNYSPETKNFIKLLIDESKLSTMQRKKINYFLRTGDYPEIKKPQKSKYPPVLIRPGSSKRRSRESIINSGAYERDKFVPSREVVDREKAKQHLQDIFAFGKNIDPTPRRVIRKLVERELQKEEKADNRFDELMQEIKERQDWLKEMEELGQGDRHRLVIQQQIQDRIRQMEKLQISEETKQ